MGDVAAAASDRFITQVRVGIPASVGGVCVAGSGGGVLHSRCGDDPHRLPLSTQNVSADAGDFILFF